MEGGVPPFPSESLLERANCRWDGVLFRTVVNEKVFCFRTVVVDVVDVMRT